MEYYCKFSLEFFILGLIGTIFLVRNMGPTFDKLRIDIAAHHKFFGGHHQKTQSMSYFCKFLLYFYVPRLIKTS